MSPSWSGQNVPQEVTWSQGWPRNVRAKCLQGNMSPKKSGQYVSQPVRAKCPLKLRLEKNQGSLSPRAICLQGSLSLNRTKMCTCKNNVFDSKICKRALVASTEGYLAVAASTPTYDTLVYCTRQNVKSKSVCTGVDFHKKWFLWSVLGWEIATNLSYRASGTITITLWHPY